MLCSRPMLPRARGIGMYLALAPWRGSKSRRVGWFAGMAHLPAQRMGGRGARSSGRALWLVWLAQGFGQASIIVIPLLRPSRRRLDDYRNARLSSIPFRSPARACGEVGEVCLHARRPAWADIADSCPSRASARGRPGSDSHITQTPCLSWCCPVQ